MNLNLLVSWIVCASWVFLSIFAGHSDFSLPAKLVLLATYRLSIDVSRSKELISARFWEAESDGWLSGMGTLKSATNGL